MLTVKDEYTHQAMTLHIGMNIGSSEVLAALYLLITKHGNPTHIRLNNDP